MLKNVYLAEIYNFYLRHFPKFRISAQVNAKNHDFYGFFMVFTVKIEVGANFKYHFRKQRTKIRKYTQFEENLGVGISGSAPILTFENLIRNQWLRKPTST